MTADQVPVDDPESLRRILVTTDALLLDFDGPICAIFANLPAHHVAEQLRAVLTEGGTTHLPAVIEKTEDPFDVLAFAATLGADEARYVEAALRAHEADAATTAPATPGAHDLMSTWHSTGRPLAIVSNNSQAAVNTYLHRHGLAELVHTVSARTEADPALLKPNPHLLTQAGDKLAVPLSRCTLVGDSLTDIQSANAAGSRAIGYANKPGKAAAFTAERPSAVTTSITALSHALLSA